MAIEVIRPKVSYAVRVAEAKGKHGVSRQNEMLDPFAENVRELMPATRTAYDTFGRITSMAIPEGTIHYQYDTARGAYHPHVHG